MSVDSEQLEASAMPFVDVIVSGADDALGDALVMGRMLSLLERIDDPVVQNMRLAIRSKIFFVGGESAEDVADMLNGYVIEQREALIAEGKDPRVVLFLDNQMNGYTSAEVIRIMAEKGMLDGVMIVVCTSDAQQKASDYSDKVDGFIFKPTQPRAIAAAIDECLRSTSGVQRPFKVVRTDDSDASGKALFLTSAMHDDGELASGMVLDGELFFTPDTAERFVGKSPFLKASRSIEDPKTGEMTLVHELLPLERQFPHLVSEMERYINTLYGELVSQESLKKGVDGRQALISSSIHQDLFAELNVVKDVPPSIVDLGRLLAMWCAAAEDMGRAFLREFKSHPAVEDVHIAISAISKVAERLNPDAPDSLARIDISPEEMKELVRLLIDLNNNLEAFSLEPKEWQAMSGDDFLAYFNERLCQGGRVNVDADLPEDFELTADQAKAVYIAVANFVRNALHVSVNASMVLVNFKLEGGVLRIQIEDDGLPFPDGFAFDFASLVEAREGSEYGNGQVHACRALHSLGGGIDLLDYERKRWIMTLPLS